MVNNSSNTTMRQNYTPEEEHRAQERAFNRAAANDANYNSTHIPQKPLAQAANDDIYTPGKEAVSAITTTKPSSPRTFGAPDLQKILRENPGASRSASYNRGYAAGAKINASIENTRKNITAIPQNIQAGIQRKEDAIRQKIGNAREIIRNAPANINKTVTEKRGAIRNNVGVGSAAGIRQTRRVNGRDVLSPRLNSRNLKMTDSKKAPQNWRELKDEAKQMAVKGGPVLFWFVAGIAMCKDMIDIISALTDLVGMGLSATVIGAPIGVALAVFSELIDKVAGLLIDFTLIAYFGYIGGGFALRLVIVGLGYIIDALPGLDVLPLTTVMFFVAYVMGRTLKKVAQVADSGLGKFVGGVARTGGRVIKAFA